MLNLSNELRVTSSHKNDLDTVGRKQSFFGLSWAHVGFSVGFCVKRSTS